VESDAADANEPDRIRTKGFYHTISALILKKAVRCSAFGVNFTFSSLFLTETHLVPRSKLWNLLRGNAECRMSNVER